MKRAVWVAALLSIGFVLTGCQKFEPEETGININENNVVRQVIKEDFSGSGYSEQELASQIEYEINTYNDSVGRKSVKSNTLKVTNGVAELTMIYASPKDFAAFNNEDFYVGDMYGAIQSGYAFEGAFREVDTGVVGKTDIWGSKLMTEGENYKTIVFCEPTLLQIPGTIKYASTNLRVVGASTVVSDTDELAYILYE